MTTVFTMIGFVCCVAITVLLTVYAVTWLIHAIVVKTTAWLRVFRFLWRFYKSIPNTKFAKGCRYHLALYDKESRTFVRVESLDADYLSEAEYERERAELKQRLRREKGEGDAE